MLQIFMISNTRFLRICCAFLNLEKEHKFAGTTDIIAIMAAGNAIPSVAGVFTNTLLVFTSMAMLTVD